MLPNRAQPDEVSEQYFQKTRMDTNGNNTSTALIGHHRNKLDLIRDSLRPFEQPTQEKFLMNATLNNQMLPESNHSSQCPVTEDSQRIMLNALTQVGYDPESAYYALKLVNFKSVTDAVKVLTSLKTYGTPEPTHLKYALGMQTSAPVQTNYNIDLPNTPRSMHQVMSAQPLPSHYPTVNEQLMLYGQPLVSNQVNYMTNEIEEQFARQQLDNYPPPINYYDSPRQIDYIQNTVADNSYLAAQQTPRERMPVKQSTSFNPAYEQKTKIVKSSSVMETPIRTTSFQATNRITLGKTDNNVPVIRSKLERPYPPSSSRRLDTEIHSNWSTKTTPAPVQNIVVDPDSSRSSSTSNQIRNEPKNPPVTITMNDLGRRAANLHVQTATPSHSLNESSSRSPKIESDLLDNTPKVHRCISPLPDSISQSIKSNDYEGSVNSCKPAMYRFFMEQHTEKIIEQYKERNKRSSQLITEMEAAGLPEKMREKMFKYLCQKESKYLRLKRQKMDKNMFELVKYIGVGAFGKVSLVRKKDTREVFAMKTLSKEDIIQKQQAAHVKAERDILAEANSEWVVKLYYSFQDAQNLYFVLEFIPGGDLMQLLINKGIFSESLSRMYTAELICAIEYVHELGFIHRDIKPDNILIDKSGHIKLTDFGLCTGLRWTHDKRHYVSYNDPNHAYSHCRDDSLNIPANAKDNIKLLQYRQHKKRNLAHSIVGTGNYMAPEVIDRSGATRTCDWWSVGVILYEMTFGRPPFLSQTDDPLDTQKKILNWRKYLDLSNPIGARLSRNCIDIITRLCCDEKDRLGRNSANEIKAHPWFKGLDFENLRKLPAEFVPKVDHAEDTSNFDTFEVNAEELFRENYPNSNAYNPAFFDFTFRHFFTNDGAHKMNHPRTQQRPSLATLIEAQPSSSSSVSTSNDKRMPKIAEAPPYKANASSSEPRKAVQPIRSIKNPETDRPQPATTHPIFNRQLQKHNIGNTNEGTNAHSNYTNGSSGLPPIAYSVRMYDKDSNV